MQDAPNPTLPPPHVLAALRSGRRCYLLATKEPRPNGGTQRIIHRYSEAARDETARRIARRKRAKGHKLGR